MNVAVIPPMTRYIILIPLAWLAGVAAYNGMLAVLWGQTVGMDLAAVLFWSLLAFLMTVPLIYLPILTLVKAVLGGYRPLLAFPTVAALVGIFPTAMIVFWWGGGTPGMLAPEAMVFYFSFAVIGIVLGIGYAWPRKLAK